MTMAWTRTLALGLLCGSLGLGASACVVSVDDDPDDNFGGDGGTYGVSGSGGDGGRSNLGGSTSGGRAGDGGAEDGSGGSDTTFPTTCDEEPGDETDECALCLKQNCCTEWLECDDDTCAIEFGDVSECVASIEFATSEDLGMCISDSSSSGKGFVQENTQALISCAIAPADDEGVELRCSTACFGSDIFTE